MIAHALEEAPNECCGLLIGRGLIIEESVRTHNLCASPTRYQIDPADHVATIRRLRGTHQSIVGAYHSHPRTAAAPSQTDRAEAFYPDFVWLIVSLLEPTGDIAAFRLADGTVTSLPIILES